MPVKFSEEDASEWLSDNVKTLAVDNSSGFSVALAPSEVFVTYSNNKFMTSTSINILPIKTVCSYILFYDYYLIFLYVNLIYIFR